jgi:hypothetical protein
MSLELVVSFICLLFFPLNSIVLFQIVANHNTHSRHSGGAINLIKGPSQRQTDTIQRLDGYQLGRWGMIEGQSDQGLDYIDEFDEYNMNSGVNQDTLALLTPEVLKTLEEEVIIDDFKSCGMGKEINGCCGCQQSDFVDNQAITLGNGGNNVGYNKKQKDSKRNQINLLNILLYTQENKQYDFQT